MNSAARRNRRRRRLPLTLLSSSILLLHSGFAAAADGPSFGPVVTVAQPVGPGAPPVPAEQTPILPDTEVTAETTPTTAPQPQSNTPPAETPLLTNTPIFGLDATGLGTAGRQTDITGTEIRDSMLQDMRQLIRYEPGVFMESAGERGGNLNFNIRGLEGNRILMTQDGIRLPSGFSFAGRPDQGRDFLDLQTIKEIRIARGAGSLVYGGDAIGGVVAFFTKDPIDYLSVFDNDSYLGAFAGYFSANQQTAETLTIAQRFGGGLEGSLVYTRRDGHETQSNGSIPQNPLNFDSDNVLGKLVYWVDDTQFIRFTGEYYTRHNGYNLISDTQAPSFSPVRVQTSEAEDETKRYRFGLDHEYADVDGELVTFARTQFYYQNYDVEQVQNDRRGTSINNITQLRTRQDYLYQRNLGGRQYFTAVSEDSWGTVHNWTYGWDFDVNYTDRSQDGLQTTLPSGVTTKNFALQSFPNKLFPDTTTRRTGAYIQDEFSVFEGALTLIPGVRGELFDSHVKPDDLSRKTVNPGSPPHDYNDQVILPKIDLILALTENSNLLATYARGFQAPPFDSNVVFSNPNGGYAVIPNANLVGEFSDNYQLGVTYSTPRASFYTNAYYNKYSNFINQLAVGTIPNPMGPPITIYQQVNIPEAEIYGWEMAGEYLLAPYYGELLRNPNGPQPGFYVFGNASYSVGNDLTHNVPINSIVPFTGIVGLRWQAPQDRWGMSFISTSRLGKSVARISEDNSFAGDFDGGFYAPAGYTVFDLLGYYRFSRNATLNVGLFNIGNRTYWDWLAVRDTPSLVGGQPNPLIQRLAEPGINASVSLSLQY